MKFYIFVWSFFGGVMAASFFSFSLAIIVESLILFLFVLLFFYKSPIFIGLVIIPALILGISRMELAKFNHGDPTLDNLLDQQASIKGVIVAEPDEKENATNLTFLPHDSKAKILVKADTHSQFQYGDEIKVEGRLVLPEKFQSENGHIFDYPNYLAKDNIFYLMQKPEISILSHNHGNFIKRKLFKLKNSFLSNLSRSLPQPYAGFLGGLIVAGKKSLSVDLLEACRRAGVLQVVVLSGYNITIVAEGIMKFFSFLPRPGALGAGALSIVLFSMMAGGSSTIIRAAVMALIALLARANHRVYDVKRGLVMAGFLMVLQNPRILVYDPSFQLSFLATLGLIILSPYFEKKFHWIPKKFQLRASVSATFSAQFLVLPLLMFQTGVISLVSVPANVLMMLLVPITMLFGFLLGLSGFINHLLALPFAFISYLFISYELFIVRFFSAMPFALISVPFPLWLLILSYAIYLLIYRVRSKRSETTGQFKFSKKASTYFFFSEGG